MDLAAPGIGVPRGVEGTKDRPFAIAAILAEEHAQSCLGLVRLASVGNSDYLDMEAFMNLIWGMSVSRGEVESSIAHREMHPETDADPGRPPERVTGRAFLLGLITIGCMCLLSENYGRGLVRSNMPVPALLMFML